MDRNYDVVIVGAGTTGSFFARKLAESGHSVLIIEASSREKVATRYDIFHFSKGDFAKYQLPVPPEGDPCWAFSFERFCYLAADGNHPKEISHPVIGLHLHEYVCKLNDWAMQAGAQIAYGCTFTDFLYDGDRLAGVRYHDGTGEQTVQARLVADCSGIPSAARRKLRQPSIVENFEITPYDVNHIVLRYVNLEEEYTEGNIGFTFYKTWMAPQANKKGAILGVGAPGSYDEAEKVFKVFEENVKLPAYTLDHIEREVNTLRRPPNAIVQDAFLAIGTCTCLNKPFNGEGITASWTAALIAAEVLDSELKTPGYLTAARLWPITRRYFQTQGEQFASGLAILLSGKKTTAAENVFLLKHDIIYTARAYKEMNDDWILRFDEKERAEMAEKLAMGVQTGEIRREVMQSILRGLEHSDEITRHYTAYPESTEGFGAWSAETERIWENIRSDLQQV